MKTSLVFFVAVCAVLSLRAERQPLERYQSIIDRQMFGPLPPGFDPTKSPSEVQKSTSASERELTKEQEQLKSSVHFSVINIAADGEPQVGFTDNSDPKAPKNYFLKVGESRDGWTVKEADAEKATMTIAKDDIEVTLSLGGNSAQDANATSRAGSTTESARGMRGGGLFSGSSLRDRKRKREAEAAEERAKQAAAAAEREAERAADEAAKEAQHEQERAEQRQQLFAIQEELKKVREAKLAAEAEKKDEDAQDDAE